MINLTDNNEKKEQRPANITYMQYASKCFVLRRTGNC
jgi:hypothetical protein